MSDLSSGILSLATAAAPETPTTAPADTSDTVDETPVDAGVDAQVDAPDADAGVGGEQDGEKASGAAPSAKELSAALKAFREANPEHGAAAKLLNDGYRRAEAYKEVFPDVQTARGVRAALDAIGGTEGLATLQSTVASVEETDALVDAGDPKVLDQIIEDSPEGFKKLAPHVLSRLQKLDAEAFGRTIQPHLVRGLADANFEGVLTALASKVSDNAEASTIVRDMQAWFESQKRQAERQNADALNPEREKIQSEWGKINEAKQKDFEGKIANQVDPHIRQTLGASLKPFSNSLKAQPLGVQQAIASAAITQLSQALDADKAFITQFNAMKGKKGADPAKVAQFANARVSALAEQVIQNVVKSFGLKQNSGRPAAKQQDGGAQRTAPNNSIVKLSKAPNDGDIDWDDPQATEAYIRGRARMKSGQFKGRIVEWSKS